MKQVRAFLDNSLEIAVAVARVVAILGWLIGVASGFPLIWAPPGLRQEWMGTVVLGFAVGLTAGYLGFYVFGNEEWKRGKAQDRGTAVRHD